MKKQITIAEVARKAGVSKATVSRAINNNPLVKRKTRQLVQNIIKTLGYHPNTAARGIRTKISKTIGIILPDITNDFFATLVRGTEDQARLSGYQIMITNTDENPNNEYADINNLLNQMVDGLIIIGTGAIKNYDQLLRSIPTIFVDRPPARGINQFDAVLLNNTWGSYQAVNNLIHSGAKRIGFINSSVPYINTERMHGYRQALSKNHLHFDKDIVKHTDRRANNVKELTGQLAINQACDGLFIANNTIFRIVLAKLKQSPVPQLKLATFDDNYFYQFLHYQLTVIQQPAYQMGQQAVINLINRINNPNLPIKHVRLNPKLKLYRLNKRKTS